MTKTNVFLISVVLILILSIEKLIPVPFLVEYELLISFMASLITIACIVQLITKFKNWKEFILMKDFMNDWRYKVVVVSIVFLIILPFFFIYRIDHLDDNYVLKNGQKTTGIISDGTIKLKGGGDYHLEVKFLTDDKTPITIEKDIMSNEDDFYIGQELDLYYLKSNPNKVLLITNNKIKDLFNIEERDVNINDLLKLFNMTKDSIDFNLNRISYKWMHVNDSVWINKRKNLFITVVPQKRLKYIYLDTKLSAYSIPYDLKEKGFESITDSTNHTAFIKDGMTIQLEKLEDLRTLIEIEK